jgi:hypothetical protein
MEEKKVLFVPKSKGKISDPEQTQQKEEKKRTKQTKKKTGAMTGASSHYRIMM